MVGNNGNNIISTTQNNGVELESNDSQINLTTDKNQQVSSTTSFIKRLLPFGGHKSNSNGKTKLEQKCNNVENSACGKSEYSSVKILKQFWNNQSATVDNCDKKQKSATLKNFSQSNDNLLDLKTKEKSLTLDSRSALTKSVESLYQKCDEIKKNDKSESVIDTRRCSLNIVDEFNKFKNADFIRNKKRLLEVKDPPKENEIGVKSKPKKSRPESLPVNFEGNSSSTKAIKSPTNPNFPKISKTPTGGKIHWATRDDIFTKRPKSDKMSVKSNPMSSEEDQKNKNSIDKEKEKEKDKVSDENYSEGTDNKMSTSVISSASSTNTTTSNTNSASRKFSFRTTPATTTHSLNKKLTAGKGSKVAQLAQRFNEMIQQDATILEEVKKRGVVVHRSGGHIFKIREDKSEYKNSLKRNKQCEDFSDDISLINCGKNSTRKKSTLKKRPSIRILIESPSKSKGSSDVVSKMQQYETNIIKKDTILIKPKIPDKSERVLAKTKELKNKKLISKKIQKTEYIVESYEINEHVDESVTETSINLTEEEYYVSPKKLIQTEPAETILHEIIETKEDEKITESVESMADVVSEPDIKIKENKSKYQKIYEMFRPSFLYGKKSSCPNKIIETEILKETEEVIIEKSVETQEEEPIEVQAFDEIEKTHDEKSSSNIVVTTEETKNILDLDSDSDDSPDVEPIDFTLNIFNTDLQPDIEHLTTNVVDESNTQEKNVMSQGQELKSSISSSQTDVVKPNQSFLFRSQSKTQFSSSCDIFIVDEGGKVETFDKEILDKLVTDSNLSLDTNEQLDKPDLIADSNATNKDNSYEIISKPNECDVSLNVCDGENALSREGSNENIYQSLVEVKKDKDSISVKSYESFENYDEITQNILNEKLNHNSKSKKEDDYELCDPEPPEPPPPRKPSEIIISPPILQSTTSNLIPDLPLPKRNISPLTLQIETYEKIKYDQIPTRPPKSPKLSEKQLPLPPRNKTPSPQCENPYEGENIYDTIKNADNRSLISGYESINNSSNKSPNSNRNHTPSSKLSDNPYRNSTNDTMSIISNCYESISLKQNYSTINQILRHAISTTTLTSEHRTNSIYGTTVGQSLTPPSDRSGSDNSDEWIDLSDDELEDDLKNSKHNFIVVCEKTKYHRSPDWSRKVRHQHLHQQRLEEWDVFVSSKSYIYLTNDPNETNSNLSNNNCTEEVQAVEPIYENIDNVNIVPSDDNKFTIYVNYDFINAAKKNYKNNKSSVRVLEPDLSYAEVHQHQHQNGDDYDHYSKTIQCQQISMYIDDSDHHYESLYSVQQQRLANEKREKDREQAPLNQLSQNPQPNISSNGLQNGISNRTTSNQIYLQDKRDYDDEYDSFESDNDVLDHIDEPKARHENGDIIHSKLPEPPSQTGQVYAIMQKIKNFGSISRSEISKGLSKIAKKKMSPKKMEDIFPNKSATSQSQFYENTQFPEDNYVNSTFESKTIGKKSKGLSKLTKLGKLTINKVPNNFNLNETFENNEFQPPSSAPIIESSPNLSQSMGNFNALNVPSSEDNMLRKKTKSSKSFKNKFRKGSAPTFSSLSSSSTSNIYSSLSTKKSTFYVTDSVDVDSGIFAGCEKTSSPDNSNLNLTVSPVIIDKKSPNIDLKRRSIAAINTSRPNNPPPPPPQNATTPTSNGSDKKLSKSKKLGTTSWYAECGLFKSETIQDEEILKNGRNDKVVSTTSWYAETGLYQTSGNSVASSSGSSGVSTGGECSPCDDNSHSMFLNEPLYQLYTAAKLESISSGEFEAEADVDVDAEADADGYEEVGKKILPEKEKKPARPSALQLIEPNQGPSRTLWSEVPEVIASGILSTLSQNEKRKQEAKFEVLTSEASYLKSLNLLRTHFMNHPAFRDPQILSPADRKALFSYIVPVQECSDRLLCDLESCWQDSIMLLGLSYHIYKHAEKYFHVYISYCEHQGKLDRTLKRLKESKAAFKETLDLLESESVCCGLNLHSFLMLPMQRITRLPLLIDAVMTKLNSDDDEFDNWKMTLALLNKIVSQCNEAANRSEQAYEMETLSKQIEFPSSISPFPLIPLSAINSGNRLSRTLVRRGELTQLIWRGDDAKLTFGKKFTKNHIYCFLFTDMLVLTKKKGEETYLVFDYCQRSMLTVSSGDVIPQLPTKEMLTAGKHLMLMTLLENNDGKHIEMIVSCPSETERQRWLQATQPPTSDNPDETLYEHWDCPQVMVKHAYQALEPDELSLDLGDVVNVSRKMIDGWYYGERIRDGSQGWFPGNFAEEVASPHVRARNLKQRYRLLTFTANYLESQKEKKK